MADYTKRWLPVQQNLAAQIEKEGGDNSWLRAETKGHAATDSAIQFSRAGSALEKSLTAAGAKPGSGRYDLGVTGINTNQAKSSGLGQMVSDQQVTQAYTQGLQALTQIGQGQAATVGSSMAQAASNSAVQAQADAQAALEEQEGVMGAVGQVAGAYAGYKLGQPNPPPVGMGSNPNGYNGTMNNPSAFVGPG
jgi:hypothetical protein